MLLTLFTALGCITCVFICTSSFCYINQHINFKALFSSIMYSLIERQLPEEEEYEGNAKYTYNEGEYDTPELEKEYVDLANSRLLFPIDFIPPSGVFTLTDEQMEDMNPDSGLYGDTTTDDSNREVCE